jgi:hypothetical protein
MRVAHVALLSVEVGKLGIGTPDAPGDSLDGVVHFDVLIEGRRYRDLTAGISLSHGMCYRIDPLAASQPVGDQAPDVWNHIQFVEACENYLRGFLSESGDAFRFDENAAGINVIDCEFAAPEPVWVRLELPPI